MFLRKKYTDADNIKAVKIKKGVENGAKRLHEIKQLYVYAHVKTINN